MNLANDAIVQTPPRSLERTDLERLIAIYRPYLRMVAERSVRGHLRARLDESDLVQESLLRGYAYLDQFCGSTEAEFRAWLTQILQHQLVSLLRYNSAAKRDLLRESPALDSLAAIAPTPSDDLLQSETRERVNSLLNQLSATQKQVVVWRNEGASFVDIANRMGSTPDAVRMIWGRAVHRLAKSRDLIAHD